MVRLHEVVRILLLHSLLFISCFQILAQCPLSILDTLVTFRHRCYLPGTDQV